ncbi:MAG: hypothetical protein DMG32_04735 [Acidobacteria bacterium]|nr:MAG: hypothetical protein DMG32_04735 [Acidobacteriota bacterium]
MLKWIIALASVALLVGARPAMANEIVNTFRGTVIASDNIGDVTTNDILNYFTGGNLIGAPFTLTFTLDPTIVDPGNPSFVDGGTFYGFPSNPISAALTINGIRFDVADSSDAFYGDGGFGANEKILQAFIFSNQLQAPGVTVDLTTTGDTSTDLTTQLPTMLLSNDDFVNNFAGFYSSNGTDNEFLTLDVQAVNSPVPEPGTMSLLGTGLACIVGRKFRAKRNLRSSVK